MKTVAYLRVSTRSQDLDNQKLAILEFSQKRRFPIDQFIESRISSRQSPLERPLARFWALPLKTVITSSPGPLTDASVSRADHEVLAHLDLRPVFVGVERELVHAAVDGDPSSIRGALTGDMVNKTYRLPPRFFEHPQCLFECASNPDT